MKKYAHMTLLGLGVALVAVCCGAPEFGRMRDGKPYSPALIAFYTICGSIGSALGAYGLIKEARSMERSSDETTSETALEASEEPVSLDTDALEFDERGMQSLRRWLPDPDEHIH